MGVSQFVFLFVSMATYGTQWEHTLFAEMNRVRTQPKAVAVEMESLRANYDGVLFKFPNGKSTKTVEGVAALNSAIQYLNSIQPVRAFASMSQGLSRAACDLVQDNGSLGLVGNTMSNGMAAAQRWVSYGQWKGKIGENIFFSIDDPRHIVYQWLIDDGTSNRPNRTTMMNDAFTTVGIAHGPHSKYSFMTVATFALSFTDGGPGYIPSVGQQRDGKHTVQSADRKTEEATLSAKGELFEINTDDLQADSVDNLTLTAKGKVLTLSKTFKSGGKTKRKNMQWQLPFSFSPADVVARYEGGEVQITLPKPNPAELQSNANVFLGEYQLQPTPGSEKLGMDVKKQGTKFVLGITGSSSVETVSISFQADIFLCTGSSQLPARLPFILSRELIEIQPESHKIVVRISKPGTIEAVEIPIRQ